MEALHTGRVRGFNSLYGQKLKVTKYIIRACESMLEQAHFDEIQTPVVVDYSTIVGENDRPVAPSDADIVFCLQTLDGQERLALSYENTMPASLFYLEHCADSPSWQARRFYSISMHFRNEPTTTELRLRQFHQVGYEIIGGERPVTLPLT